MGNDELIYWEMKDMAAASRRKAGRPRRALQIDREVRNMAAAQRLMVKETHRDEELTASTLPVRRHQPAQPRSAGFTRIFTWLIGQ